MIFNWKKNPDLDSLEDNILDFLSMEIYAKREDIVLVNSIEYLCDVLAGEKDNSYFLDLSMDFVHFFNKI